MKRLDYINKKDIAERAGYMLLGNLLSALAVDLFLAGTGISGGGFAGIAIILNYVTPVPVGAFVFVASIPLFVWAWFVKGWRYVAVTAACTAVYSVMTDALAALPTLTDDRFLAAICGGGVYALSEICLLKSDCCTGGTDLLARLLLTRRKDSSLGRMFILTDGVIIAASALVSGQFEIGLYGLVTVLVCSVLTDKLVLGVNRALIFQIVCSDGAEAIARAVMDELGRGVTCIQARGMFSGESRDMLTVAVGRRQVSRLKAIVRQCDPAAFVILMEASEIMGEGFRNTDQALHGTREKPHR